jgi:hypothetical protein
MAEGISEAAARETAGEAADAKIRSSADGRPGTEERAAYP